MALIKIIDIGDELTFDLTKASRDVKKVSITLVERTGRKAVLKLDADRSIPIKHFRQQNMGRR